MATERLVTGKAIEAEEQVNWSLRPTHLGEYVGQRDLVTKLQIAIEAARGRKEPMEHTLLHGPPGLGKTTLAHVIGAEMGTRVSMTSGPALSRSTDLVSALTRLENADVLFIDEIHRLPPAVEEFLYPAMEDFRIDVPVDSGIHARTVQIALKPFTLIGATTRKGLVSAPMRSRFGIEDNLQFYAEHELVTILARSARLLNMQPLDAQSLIAIASRSRGTPRIANRLLRRVRDFGDVRAGGKVNDKIVREAMTLEGVDDQGLDRLDRQYLGVLAKTYECRAVGLETIAATMNEDSGTLQDVVEPYLLRLGMLSCTPRGREITRSGCEHIGVTYTSRAGLFES